MPELITIIAVFFIGVIAAFIGAIAGGGGLLSISFLIFVGLPPHVAIATNRLGALGMSISMVYKFSKAKVIEWKYVPWLSLLAIIGSYIGAKILLNVSEETLNFIVVMILVAFLPILLIKKKLGVKKINVSFTKNFLGYILYFFMAIFGGFFGGGSGTIFFFILMYFFGFTIIEANATDSIPWLLLSVSALVVFATNHIINYTLGTSIFLGMVVGGYLGAHTAIQKGNKWVKTFLIVIIIASIIKLLFF